MQARSLRLGPAGGTLGQTRKARDAGEWKDPDNEVVPLVDAARPAVDPFQDADRTIPPSFLEHALLTADEEKSLAHRSKAGDLRARNELVAGNLRLVVSLARPLLGYGLPMVDLVQEGIFGLIRASEKFDPASNCRFSTYAYFWIRQAMLKGLARHKRTIRVPHFLDGLISRARRESQDPRDIGATLVTIARQLGLPEDRIHQALAADQGDMSLENAPERGGRLLASGGAADPEDVVLHRILGEELDGVLSSLTAREAHVLRARFGLGDGQSQTLQEVGHALGITKEAVRQIQKRALVKLREPRTLEALEQPLN